MGERQLSSLKTVLLLGVAGLLMQRVNIGYPSFLSRSVETASLVHPQAGLLLAVAMLFRSTRILAGVCAVLYLGWIADWMFFMQGAVRDLPVGLGGYALLFGLTWGCARLMGWPRAPAQARLQLADLPRFFGVGMLLYPTGLALIAAVMSLYFFAEGGQRLAVTVEVFFAKLFGVLVVTLPLVTAWTERRTPIPRHWRLRSLGWLVLLVAVVVASYAFERYLRHYMGAAAGASLPLMDFRFTLFVLLGAAVIRLRYPLAMLMLAGCLLLIAYGAASAATLSNTPLGFINLLHIAVELGVLQVAMLYLLLVLRDGRGHARRLDEETRIDAVTGLPNLKALRGQATTMRFPNERQLGFLVLDRTEDLVSAYGLDVQAEVMRQAAGRLDQDVRPFVVGTGQLVLLPCAGAQMDTLWERLMESLQHVQIEAGGGRFRLLPYLGVAVFEDDARDALEAALRHASQLAFQARRNSELHPVMQEAQEMRVGSWQTSTDAEDALSLLREGRVELYFQPIHRLDPITGRIEAGAALHGEVLCRLRDEHDTLRMPGDFLPQIEAMGRGAELDLAVVRALFALLRASPEALSRFARLSINLTGQSLASSGFARTLVALLDAAPIGGAQLIFEITETAAILQASNARALLDRLRERGCLIAIDDFGVGMQSFERLKTLPVDMIKIDGSFVRNVTAGGKDHAVVQACVAVAQAFGAQTVAEFVEDTPTADCLHALGVDWVQGYLISPPYPLQTLLEHQA